MKRYLVELEAGERGAVAITEGRAFAEVSALVLLNCDAGEFRAARDRPGHQRAQGGPGQEAVCGGRSGSEGRRAKYLRKADGEFEARLVGYRIRRGARTLRLLADVELGYIDGDGAARASHPTPGGASAG